MAQCGDMFSACVCDLSAHEPTEPHVCECGGSWQRTGSETEILLYPQGLTLAQAQAKVDLLDLGLPPVPRGGLQYVLPTPPREDPPMSDTPSTTDTAPAPAPDTWGDWLERPAEQHVEFYGADLRRPSPPRA